MRRSLAGTLGNKVAMNHLDVLLASPKKTPYRSMAWLLVDSRRDQIVDLEVECDAASRPLLISKRSENDGEGLVFCGGPGKENKG
jgi:hypothetical protein